MSCGTCAKNTAQGAAAAIGAPAATGAATTRRLDDSTELAEVRARRSLSGSATRLSSPKSELTVEASPKSGRPGTNHASADGEIGITDAELAALRAKTTRMSALLRRALHGPIYHDDALAEDIETELDGAR